ncbi:MAG: ParB/RepB/Spo0J family partition protein [Candidatus Nitrosopumilus sp. bin_32a]
MPSNSNKFKKFDYIELDKLYVGLSNVRVENATDEEELSILAEHIGKHGLLEPIVVFAVNDLEDEHPLYESRKSYKNQYEILAGQRRWTAFKKLNKENPGEGWDKIPCHVREAPDDEVDAKAISLGEGLTQLPYTMTDIIDACDTLFKKYNDPKIVAKMTGISDILVNRYVKFARLPKFIQENLGSIHKTPKTAVNLAVEAADALAWSKDSEIPEQKVYDLAMKLGEKKKNSQEEYKKLKQAAEENPKESLAKIEEESLKIMSPKKFSIVLDAKTAIRLESAAERSGHDPGEEASDIIQEGLDRREGHSSEE